jgi:hypothetical protein
MTLGAYPIATEAIAADPTAVSSLLPYGAGVLAPFAGSGYQGDFEFRGERFWANSPPTRFRARETDGEGMIGTTDKDPLEYVWYEVDWSDVLNGASIVTVSYSLDAGLTLLGQSLETNGEVNFLTRFFLSGGPTVGTAYLARVSVVCSDASRRKRTLKIRSREL